MFMVIVLHYLGKGGLLTPVGEPFDKMSWAAWLVEAFAIVAVNVYVLITGYFLCEGKLKISRVVGIILQVLWYSLLIPVVLAVMGVVQFSEFNMYDWLRFVFPVHMKHYWFVTAYILLMLFVPFLNAGIRYMNQKQLAYTTLLMTVYQTLPKSILPVKFTDDEAGNHVLWLVCLYLTAAYIRKYGIPFFTGLRRSLLCYIGFVCGIFASLLVMRAVYFRLDAFGESINFGYHYNHILCMAAAVSLFYVFKYWNLQDGAFRRMIGRIAPYTFGAYLLHEHILVRDRWPGWLQVAPTDSLLCFFAALIIKTTVVLAVGMGLDWLRACLFKALAGLPFLAPVQRGIKRMDDIL